ncbi:hypothetical protein VE03_03889 [Pseudogymnoascus sp. 23342-1-I1]|nr:hypothetical protein VE03_03889 [Pseudogymnoascus sp. 23342-1-I1]
MSIGRRWGVLKLPEIRTSHDENGITIGGEIRAESAQGSGSSNFISEYVDNGHARNNSKAFEDEKPAYESNATYCPDFDWSLPNMQLPTPPSQSVPSLSLATMPITSNYLPSVHIEREEQSFDHIISTGIDQFPLLTNHMKLYIDSISQQPLDIQAPNQASTSNLLRTGFINTYGQLSRILFGLKGYQQNISSSLSNKDHTSVFGLDEVFVLVSSLCDAVHQFLYQMIYPSHIDTSPYLMLAILTISTALEIYRSAIQAYESTETMLTPSDTNVSDAAARPNKEIDLQGRLQSLDTQQIMVQISQLACIELHLSIMQRLLTHMDPIIQKNQAAVIYSERERQLILELQTRLDSLMERVKG